MKPKKKSFTELDVAHALVFASDAKPIKQRATWASWTPECLDVMSSIVKQATENLRQSTGDPGATLSIPSSSLRMLLQIQIDEVLSIENHTGLAWFSYYRPKPFILMQQSGKATSTLYDCIEAWLDETLTPFIEEHGVEDRLREQLYTHLDNEQIISVQNGTAKLFPWSTYSNATAHPENETIGYAMTANDIAARLEGQCIFPELPPVMRVIGNNGNKAELMTPIIRSLADKGLFSLVCEISLETMPTVPFPLIFVNFKRRRWLKSLTTGYTPVKSIGGYVLNESQGRAYRFEVVKQHIEKQIWEWEADDAWDVLRQKFDLPASGKGDDLLTYIASNDLPVAISHRYGLEDDDKIRIGSGVVESDRVNAFGAIKSILANIGLKPFEEFEDVRHSRFVFQNMAYLDLQTVIAEREVLSDDDETVDEGKSGADNSDLDAMLKEMDQEWQEELKLLQKYDPARNEKVENMIALNQSLINSVTLGQQRAKPTVLLVTEDRTQQPFLRTVVERLFGDSLKIKTAPLPDKTHGPKEDLPASAEKGPIRMAQRQAIWKTFIQQPASSENNVLCLIQAREFYRNEGRAPKRDDYVNKPAAKIAIASEANIPTQYLKPINEKKRDREKQLKDYIHRTQSALLDLVFGHSGLVPGITDHTLTHFTEVLAPKALLGISIIQVQSSVRRKPSAMMVASRIDVSNGIPLIRFGHYDADLQLSEWMPFNEAIGYVCKRFDFNLRVGKDRATRQQSFQGFCKTLLNEEQQRGSQACVFIDASNTNKFWSWLSDKELSDGEARFSDGSKSWWKDLRLIRVRHQAPPIMVEKYLGDMGVHTSCPRLLRVTTGSLPIYWSLGHPPTKVKRGVSVYRNTQLLDKGVEKTYEPWFKNAPTPNAVEFTILNKLKEDDNDNLARFASALRRGVIQGQVRLEKWVCTPAPLFILNKIEEYMGL